MKALSLWEPWATAIAIGAKKIETRGWATSYRGPLAIHAAKTKDYADTYFHPVTPAMRLVYDAFTAAGIGSERDLSFGCVIATCELVRIDRTEDIRDGLTPLERELGGYDDGRFGWHLANVVRLDVPVPARGLQQLWEWNPDAPKPPAQGALAI